jgi:hypothetical protein
LGIGGRQQQHLAGPAADLPGLGDRQVLEPVAVIFTRAPTQALTKKLRSRLQQNAIPRTDAARRLTCVNALAGQFSDNAIEPPRWLAVMVAGGEPDQDVEMSMLQSEIKSSRKEAAGSVAGMATVITVAALAILALLETHVGVIALAALLVLGSILILNDRSITVEPHIMLT